MLCGVQIINNTEVTLFCGTNSIKLNEYYKLESFLKDGNLWNVHDFIQIPMLVILLLIIIIQCNFAGQQSWILEETEN